MGCGEIRDGGVDTFAFLATDCDTVTSMVKFGNDPGLMV